jgi:cellulose synthase/poly-beta-1,6-N-acetylglucosamine synthase-like glycosyltransferase
LTLLIIISVLFSILLVSYAILLFKYNKRFSAITEFEPRGSSDIKVSVLIPARDEEKNIGPCIDALRQQDHVGDHIEIIVIDDHSSDQTAAIASSKHATVIALKDEDLDNSIAFKKMAIATGIKYAKGDMILTTDADCIVPPDWINTMSGVLKNTKAVMVAGPVRMVPENSLLSRFQALDFAILQGITAASVHSGYHDMSSGANLGYLKNAFYDVNGFEGIDDIATGDDMLLMQKFSSKFPGRISYAFSRKAIVDTRPEETLGAFFRQRIRWASKARRYQDKKIFRILLLVYLLNVCTLFFLVMALISPLHFSFCLAAFMLKTIVEWSFTNNILNFFSLSYLMPLFPFMQPLHVIYTVVSGTFGQFGAVKWKGRKVK